MGNASVLNAMTTNANLLKTITKSASKNPTER